MQSGMSLGFEDSARARESSVQRVDDNLLRWIGEPWRYRSLLWLRLNSAAARHFPIHSLAAPGDHGPSGGRSRERDAASRTCFRSEQERAKSEHLPAG